MQINKDISVDNQIELIRRGAVEVISENELRRKLITARDKDRPLRVKLGLDPTAPDIHLGIAVVLRKLRLFQDLGHEVIIIIGDFTAAIGDPSGKSKTRPQLSAEEIQANAETYSKQYCQILEPERTQVVFNSEWLDQMTFSDVIKLTARTTVARVLERDDFVQRLENNTSVGVHEILYPICQGYDSVVLKADIEMGGTDQKFNNLMGRDLQRADGQEPQVVLLMPLLVGLDGTEKMSKSLGNYVGIHESPNNMYGKLMSIPDELIFTYLELTTDVPLGEIHEMQSAFNNGELHPKIAKQRLAREVVSIYHQNAAQSAETYFERVHKNKELPDEIPEVTISPKNFTDGKIWIAHIIAESNFAQSSSEAIRLVKQGAVKLNGERITDDKATIEFQNEAVLQVGKRKFARLILSST
ncbi:MAG: tyrosine--tRNA ligase [Candidatus Poribacteria bacterium]|nr:tyrosine--tRNA ligase [Candidatus Poribacteria bacterium]